jgi:hypothetical protein
MGNPFDQDRPQGKGQRIQRPWSYELTWHTTQGVFRFKEFDDEGNKIRQGDIASIAGVVLDADLFQITGRNQTGTISLFSTLGKHLVHDGVKLFMKNWSSGSKAEVLVEGSWSTIKETPFKSEVPHRKWNRVVFVQLLKAKVAEYDSASGKTGKMSVEKFDKVLCKMSIGGGAAKKGWSDVLREQELQSGDIMGMGFQQGENGESPGNDNFPTFYNPSFQFKAIDLGKSSGQKTIDEAYSLYEELKKYLETEWGHEDYLAHDPNEPDDKEPGTQLQAEPGVEDDDDLPF